eukprot:gnl/TRDRNA2_/TRDRNA2_72424_c0_seq1.p1 gnl/TRDRNA2_/TRDRNA2_72424_c0~~gnl/TRDRNA2_/TRDRNA2_72424_c0_seq1.p1  ORF type:complete len:296 (+),score=38.43 gnl/TRDRNA2_/TRDRNA2_72424_c0_seq1:21-908(+)
MVLFVPLIAATTFVSATLGLDTCPGDPRKKCPAHPDLGKGDYLYPEICLQLIDLEANTVLEWEVKDKFNRTWIDDFWSLSRRFGVSSFGNFSSNILAIEGGDCWCVTLRWSSLLMQKVGCENVKIRCSATDVGWEAGGRGEQWRKYVQLYPIAMKCFRQQCVHDGGIEVEYEEEDLDGEPSRKERKVEEEEKPALPEAPGDAPGDLGNTNNMDVGATQGYDNSHNIDIGTADDFGADMLPTDDAYIPDAENNLVVRPNLWVATKALAVGTLGGAAAAAAVLRRRKVPMSGQPMLG